MAEAEFAPEEASNEVRTRILEAAAALIRSSGAEAATTRAVAMAAAVQPPTIYRLFGDKGGLLDAVVERELFTYVAGKQGRRPHPDPVEDMRQGWDMHVAFGLANPALFRIMSSNPRSPAAAAGLRVLAERVRAIARAARLRTGEERAAAMLHAACTGTVLTLVGDGENADPGLSGATREAVLSAITTDPIAGVTDGVAAAAATLRARLDEAGSLTKGEKGFLDELLLRLGAP